MRRVACGVAMVAALGTPGAARAEEPRAGADASLQAILSIGTGPTVAGRQAYSAAGPDLEIGHRVGPVWLMARGSWMAASVEPPAEGRSGDVWRYSAALRVPIGHIALDESGFGMRLWADGGVGRRVIHWDGGGREASREWALGVGWEGGAQIAPDDPRRITIGLGIRALFAERRGGGHDPATVILLRLGWAQ